jgi:hypothetical protein
MNEYPIFYTVFSGLLIVAVGSAIFALGKLLGYREGFKEARAIVDDMFGEDKNENA